ncbi:spondin domain-containing protein [Cognaticolwellia mytili]|uniref:spondin domain-containing protein n=1 Tax=Cognaticolwellia mytili TaxID=1888913 RepID=UPI000A16E907|nr:spondin domain-containing protein [Cognaticolwellia mytili]
MTISYKNQFARKGTWSAIGFTILLSACGGSDNNSTPEPVTPTPPAPVTYTYEVSVTNLTNAQPLSPVAVILHNEGALFELGASATVALENLAESGDNSEVLAQDMVLAGASGSGVIMPGMSDTVSVSLIDTKPMMLSTATMLVNTNDAFSGINAMSLENMAVGESISLRTSSYDSGTEKNSETMATIPGPAAGGEGFNVERDDVDFISMHSGVVSNDDGLMQSVLTQAHRFDNPTLAISVTRVE